ncbi:hypothetical protein GCK32_021143, partial [Trichostrongylus colubriformis]
VDAGRCTRYLWNLVHSKVFQRLLNIN